mgnify:CR=1 FL=1
MYSAILLFYMCLGSIVRFAFPYAKQCFRDWTKSRNIAQAAMVIMLGCWRNADMSENACDYYNMVRSPSVSQNVTCAPVSTVMLTFVGRAACLLSINRMQYCYG